METGTKLKFITKYLKYFFLDCSFASIVRHRAEFKILHKTQQAYLIIQVINRITQRLCTRIHVVILGAGEPLLVSIFSLNIAAICYLGSFSFFLYQTRYLYSKIALASHCHVFPQTRRIQLGTPH